MAATKLRVQNLWIACYQNKISLPPRAFETSTFIDSNDDDDLFHSLLNTDSTPAEETTELPDEYVKYITKKKDESVSNPLQWWRVHQSAYPNLAQMALDLFAIPAMSSECERAFSKASYTISARRSNLSSDIVEGGETFRSWVSAGVIKMRAPAIDEIES